MPVIALNPNRSPRSGLYHDVTGSYQPVIVIDNTVADRDKLLKGRLYFSGYGRISQAKVAVFAPRNIFVESESRWKAGFKPVAANGLPVSQTNPAIGYEIGETVHNRSDVGVIHLSAAIIVQGQGPIVDLFSDSDANAQLNDKHTIYSEMSNSTAPLSFELKIRKDCKPGTHEISIIFTYFDGENWKSVFFKAPFVVRNILQRYDWQIALTALSASAIAILVNLPTAVQRIAEFLKWSFPPF